MSKYNQQQATGESWQRCYNISIENPYLGTPTAIFREEVIVEIGDTAVKNPKTACMVTFSPNAEFPVLNPETGEPTGQTLTHQQLYTYLHSLYIKTATDRDNPTFGPVG